MGSPDPFHKEEGRECGKDKGGGGGSENRFGRSPEIGLGEVYCVEKGGHDEKGGEVCGDLVAEVVDLSAQGLAGAAQELFRKRGSPPAAAHPEPGGPVQEHQDAEHGEHKGKGRKADNEVHAGQDSCL